MSFETCRADLKRLINDKVVAFCWLFTWLYITLKTWTQKKDSHGHNNMTDSEQTEVKHRKMDRENEGIRFDFFFPPKCLH